MHKTHRAQNTHKFPLLENELLKNVMTPLPMFLEASKSRFPLLFSQYLTQKARCLWWGERWEGGKMTLYSALGCVGIASHFESHFETVREGVP